jgi:hypothetical protein
MPQTVVAGSTNYFRGEDETWRTPKDLGNNVLNMPSPSFALTPNALCVFHYIQPLSILTSTVSG